MKKELTPEEYLNRVLSSEPDEECPVRRALFLLSGKWRTHIIYELCKNRVMRFGELKKSLRGITNSMLSAALRELEDNEIVHREQFASIPPKVEYSLTEKGKALLPVFTELAKWSENHAEKTVELNAKN